MNDILLDALLDTLKLIPFLFITFLLLEYIEHKLSKKSEKALLKYKNIGPAIGGTLGAVPQCGFSAMAANLFSGKIITMGTLIAIFLSTSDEMLPILIGEQVKVSLIVRIVIFKVLIGILIGFLVDLIYRPSKKKNKDVIAHLCEDEHCHCEDGIFKSSVIHTLLTSLYILIANLIIGFIIFKIGEDKLSSLLSNHNILVYFVSSLIGLIPNCAASVIITEVYVNGIASLGVAMSGLLTGSGLGILLLFKSNKSLKENFSILGIVYFTGVIIGILIDMLI